MIYLIGVEYTWLELTILEGFHFKEKINELEIQDRGKKGYQFTFTLDNKGDSYFFTLDISKLGYANLRVSSTRRSLISYDGVVESAFIN